MSQAANRHYTSEHGLRSKLKGWFGRKQREKIIIPVRGGASAWLPSTTTQTQVQKLDKPLVWVVLCVLMFSIVMVYSASIALTDARRFQHLPSYYFVFKHAVSIGLGLVCMLFMLFIPVRIWEKYSRWIFTAAVIMLIAVLILGPVVNGARRWVSLGIMNFQPSEFAKFAMVLYASSYMVRKMEVKEKFFTAVTPMVVALALLGGLILAEPDMGAFMVIAIIAMGILFIGGVNARMFFLISIVLVGAFAMIVLTSPWRMERIFAYLKPWAPEHVYGSSYQLTFSLISFGRGTLFGVGLGNSMGKMNWLPEAHTDFILAVVGEELGYAGVIALLIVFFWMTRRMIFIGRQCIALDRVFAGLAAQGVALWIGFQVFINFGVNLGALPTKGLTLPLVSYGGSAILMNLIAIGLVLRIDLENRALRRGEK